LGLHVAPKVEWRIILEFDWRIICELDGRDIRKIRDWMEILGQTVNEHKMNDSS
jgi:hypothetical protein